MTHDRRNGGPTVDTTEPVHPYSLLDFNVEERCRE
jgi:hypothetical protein